MKSDTRRELGCGADPDCGADRGPRILYRVVPTRLAMPGKARSNTNMCIWQACEIAWLWVTYC